LTDELRTLVEQLKAVSHPLRLRVLALLEAGELCVCQIAETLQVPQSSVSEALRELRRAGFVVERKEGRWVFMAAVPKRRATPFLKGLMAEAGILLEVQQDRDQAEKVKALSIQAVCSKAQKTTPASRGRVRA
jgi:ArsR family transcriptional regulator, arsenate/arsenite/antimonite-responsive transcriptional repressor